MSDVTPLDGLDPYGFQDRECTRLALWLGELDEAEWAAPSACAGCSRRDLLAHLVAVEK